MRKNKYLFPWVHERFYKRLIRWLYIRYLDELYIPEGTEFNIIYKHPNIYKEKAGEIKCISLLCQTTKVRRGMQQVFIYNYAGIDTRTGERYEIVRYR